MKNDDSYNLRKLFEEIELDLIKSMKRTFKRHEAEERKEGFKWEQWQSAKLRNIREYRNRNREIVESKSKEIEDIVNKALDSNYKKGENFFSKAVKKISNLFFKKKRLDTPKNVSDYKTSYTPKENDFFGMNDKKLDAMKEVVNNDLKKGQNAILRRMDDVYRQTIYKAEIHMTAGAKTLNQAIDMATKEFLNKGIDCIEYKDGKRVNIASYAEMALRTASHRATLLGEGKNRDAWGIHTVVVSAHGNTCPKCEKWQGEVLIDDVFSHGTVEEAIEGGYYLLSFAIKSGLLHPNCRHTISTYFPGITQIPTIPDGKEAIKKYEAEQEQRGLEREIKKWKRIAEGSQDPDNINFANSKVRDCQKELREHLKKHPYLRRDYSREKARDVPYKPKEFRGTGERYDRDLKPDAKDQSEFIDRIKGSLNPISKPVEAFKKELDNVPDSDVKALLEQSLKRAELKKSDRKKSYFSRSKETVYLSEDCPPSTVAHELFHEVDYTYGISESGMLSDVLKNDFSTMSQSANEYGGSLENMLYSKYPKMFLEDYLGDRVVYEEYRGLSDIINGLTHGSVDLGYKHSIQYWDRPLSIERETWAQYGRMLYENNPDVSSVLSELLPETNKAISNILKGMIK